MFCKHCNHGIEAGDVFCEACGQKVVWEQNTSSPCKHCGYSIEDGDIFCENCGQKAATKRVSPMNIIDRTKVPAVASTVTDTSRAVAPINNLPLNNQIRMPLLFLLDTSSSVSPYISRLNADLNDFKAVVCRDEQAKSILDVAIVQFNTNFDVLMNFTPAERMSPVRLISGGSARYDAAIHEALRMAEIQSHKAAKSHKPWIVFITCGEPSDNINAVSNDVKNAQSADKLRFIALGAGTYDSAALKQITDIVFRLDGSDFSQFFNWVSGCMGAIARTSPGTKPQLPQLHGDVYRDV